MWNRLSEYYEVKLQPNGIDKYMDTPDVLIYDNKAGFVKNYRVIKNHNSDWLNITFSNGRIITCTPDHPFETENRGVVQAKDLTKEDEIKIDISSNFVDNDGISVDKNKAWYHGIVMFDSLYNEVFTWNKESRLNFVTGMIDTAGYFDVESEYKTAYLDFKDKKCAIQQMLLIQTLGMPVSIAKSRTGYTIAFNPTKELIDIILLNQPEYEITITKDIVTDIVHLSSLESFTKQGFSYDVTTESEHFTVSGIYSHNCRSFLTPDRFTDAGIGNIANALNYKPNKHKYYGRFNQGVVTLNLPDIALSSGKDIDKFWQIFDERLELCYRALMYRHNRLKGTKSDIAPILWQHGALARLKKGETIDKLLYNGYSTISLGYAGLYECVKYMTGKSHTDPEARPFALQIMQHMKDACDKWKAKENIDFSPYGTPKRTRAA